MFQGASYERYVVYGVRPLRKRRVASRMTISMSAWYGCHTRMRVHR